MDEFILYFCRAVLHFFTLDCDTAGMEYIGPCPVHTDRWLVRFYLFVVSGRWNAFCTSERYLGDVSNFPPGVFQAGRVTFVVPERDPAPARLVLHFHNYFAARTNKCVGQLDKGQRKGEMKRAAEFQWRRRCSFPRYKIQVHAFPDRSRLAE